MKERCQTCHQPIPTDAELERRRARQRRWQAKMRARAAEAAKVARIDGKQP